MCIVVCFNTVNGKYYCNADTVKDVGIGAVGFQYRKR